jgi:hypothetical protein
MRKLHCRNAIEWHRKFEENTKRPHSIAHTAMKPIKLLSRGYSAAQTAMELLE